MLVPRSTTLARDLNVLTGRAPASNFFTISSGVCFVGTVSVSVASALFSAADDGGFTEEIGANETDGRAVFSGSAEDAIVRDMISKADDFDGGGCLGAVACDSTDGEG